MSKKLAWLGRFVVYLFFVLSVALAWVTMIGGPRGGNVPIGAGIFGAASTWAIVTLMLHWRPGRSRDAG